MVKGKQNVVKFRQNRTYSFLDLKTKILTKTWTLGLVGRKYHL